MGSGKGSSTGLEDFVSPIRLRWTILILGFVIGAASIGLAIWILVSIGTVSVGPSTPPLWDATPFAAVLVMVGAAALLVINVRAHRRDRNRGDAGAQARTRWFPAGSALPRRVDAGFRMEPANPRRRLPPQAYPIFTLGFVLIAIALALGFADSVGAVNTATELPFFAVFGLTGWGLVLAGQIIFRRRRVPAVKIRTKSR